MSVAPSKQPSERTTNVSTMSKIKLLDDRVQVDAVLDGYVSLVGRRVDRGWAAYYVEPVFKHLSGSPTVVLPQMLKETAHVYQAFLRRVGRRDTPKFAPIAPIMIAAPKLPTSERNQPVQALRGSECLGVHGLLAVPPRRWVNVSVQEYFREQQARYAAGQGRVYGVRVLPIGRDVERAFEYAMKGVRSGPYSLGQVLALPRQLRAFHAPPLVFDVAAPIERPRGPSLAGFFDQS